MTGVDLFEGPETTKRLDVFVRADLELWVPDEVGGGFDVAVAADDRTHVRFFTRRSLLRMVKKNGFEVAEIRVGFSPSLIFG